MSKIELLEPFLEEGIHNTNFFNGRLLSAEDLLREQQANRLQHQQLGQAVGEGVAYGLEVRENKAVTAPSGTPARIVSVSAGMAINRLGQPLYLPLDTDVALVREKEAPAEDAGLFSPCTKPIGTDILSGTGIYILVISPASGYEGQAPASGLGGDLSSRGGCRRRDTVAGVLFRLVEVKLDSLGNINRGTIDRVKQLAKLSAASTDQMKNLSKMRNEVAHLCFGTENHSGARDPLDCGTYGIVDAVKEKGALTDCDVPLAIIYWTTDGIQFVDAWSVRRRSIPLSTSAALSNDAGQRRVVYAEAVLFQFQAQLEELRMAAKQVSDLATFTVTDYFSYLPACGFIPATLGFAAQYMKNQGSEVQFSAGEVIGFDPIKFFDGVAISDPVFLEDAKISAIVQESFDYPAIVLTSHDLVWLYIVRDNVKAAGDGSTASQPYLLFATGYMPFRGAARFDLSRWDYSNYA